MGWLLFPSALVCFSYLPIYCRTWSFPNKPSFNPTKSFCSKNKISLCLGKPQTIYIPQSKNKLDLFSETLPLYAPKPKESSITSLTGTRKCLSFARLLDNRFLHGTFKLLPIGKAEPTTHRDPSAFFLQGNEHSVLSPLIKKRCDCFCCYSIDWKDRGKLQLQLKLYLVKLSTKKGLICRWCLLYPHSTNKCKKRNNDK